VLAAKEISHARGGQVVLDGVSLTVNPGDRVGVVGPNGIGKTTLLRILVGLEEPDAGLVDLAPASLTIGYLPQEPDALAGETLRAYLARRTGVADAEAELERRTAIISGDPETIEAYSHALERFLALGGSDLDARIGEVLAQVGLSADRLDVEVGALSGGQAARAALAAILLSRFDVLLLDEPTNGLDFAGLELLERFVVTSQGAMVIVSHDRAFLDRTVTRIVELREHHRDAVEYAGGWSDYVAARELARRQQYDAHDKYVSERDRLTDRQRTQRQWSQVGVRNVKTKKKDNDKSIAFRETQRSEKQASKVKATEKAIERLDAVDKPWEGWELQLDLTPAGRPGDTVARLQRAVITRGSFTLGPVDIEIAWQDRVAIVGANGTGKSTLLNAIIGTVPLDSGERWVGPSVVFGTLDQARHAFDGPEPLLDRFLRRTGMPLSEARSQLAKLSLGAEEVARACERLSPGERTRATLAALVVEGTNCLVLDEPTNHLDLAAIEQLEAALDAFTGTLLLVTHDRALLEAVNLTRTIEVNANGVVVERA
jgi:ATPase subunit of ABC transporter with duplicated ATPase domains